MKKLLFALIAILLIAVVFAPNVATAEEAGGNNGEQPMYVADFVEQLCKLRREGGDAKAFLKEKFNVALAGHGAVSEQPFYVDGKDYVNLFATLEKPGERSYKQIIIGAHYDSVGEGAGDNACGVAALYYAMQSLALEVRKLPCNVTFVAFDGEEGGLLGSQYYVSKMRQADIDNTLVMFNFDSVASGDKLYLMCENKSTDLAKLLLSNPWCGIVEKPYAKGTFNLYDPYGYGYYERVQGSDHTPFRLAGIPTAFFFSGTYSATVWNYAESADPNKVVMNTLSDTYENLVKNCSDFDSRILSVAGTVVDTVLSDEFMPVAENARKQLVNLNFWYNILWPIIAAVVIAIVAIVLAIFYHRKLQKNAILGGAEIKNQTVFDKPKAEDIFSFKSDDADDIFTYKK